MEDSSNLKAVKICLNKDFHQCREMAAMKPIFMAQLFILFLALIETKIEIMRYEALHGYKFCIVLAFKIHLLIKSTIRLTFSNPRQIIGSKEKKTRCFQ